MAKQNIANIYLADQRGLTLSDQYRSWHTFNYGQYQHPHREALGALRVFNEETLAGGQQMTYVVQAAQSILLLPLVGGIEVQVAGKLQAVEAGALLELPLSKGEKYQVQNPYGDLVSYVQIELQVNDSNPEGQLHGIDLEHHHNALQAILPPQKPYQLSLGKFDGRVDVEHFLTKSEQTAFVFVIDGVFEVQNRLLHARDALFLSLETSLEFEALANEAILLILEF